MSFGGADEHSVGVLIVINTFYKMYVLLVLRFSLCEIIIIDKLTLREETTS